MPGGPWPDDGEGPYREEQDTDDGAGASAERADMIYSHMVGEHPDLNSTAASLLGFLESYGPMSGYDIVGMVEGSIGYFWNVTRSQVYRELNRLAEAELVEMGESGARARRPYTITGAGRRAFLNWLALPPGPDIIRLPFLLRYFFGQHLDPQTLRAFVDLHRPQHEQRLHYFQSLIPKLLDEQPFMAHVAELGVAYEETMLAWFDTIPREQARQQATRDLKAVHPVKEASPPDSASA